MAKSVHESLRFEPSGIITSTNDKYNAIYLLPHTIKL